MNPSPTDHECMHFLYFRQSDLYEQFPPMPSLYYIYNNKERKHSIQRFKIFHNPKFWTWSILTHHIFFYVFSRVYLFSIYSSCRGLSNPEMLYSYTCEALLNPYLTNLTPIRMKKRQKHFRKTVRNFLFGIYSNKNI